MTSLKRFDRKQFLTWGLTTTSVWALGCSAGADDGTPATPNGGSAGSGGSSSSAGSTSAGTGGTFATAGTTSTGGASGGSAGNTSAGTAGSGGSAGSSAGTGGSGGTSTVAANCASQLMVFISGNHGHVMMVTAADVMTGMMKVYDTKGTADHEHFIQLTAADFTKLQTGGTVRKLSCNGGHEHEYIVNCLGVAMPTTTSGIPGFCDAGHLCAGTNTDFCPELP